jgi:uncharacterized protein YbjT (DUF2867 family)
MILVTGSTGQVGSATVEELARLGAGVRAFARSGRHLPAGAEVVEGSFEDAASVRRALDGVKTLFLLTPTGTDDALALQRRLIDLAADAGVERVVKQSVIAADEPGAPRIMQAHRAAEQHLERSGMAWTHLRPCWFMQNELAQAPSVASTGSFHAPSVGRVSMVDARDVAAAAAAVLTGDGHEGRAYVLTGPEPLSYLDIADRYTHALGRPVSWVEASLGEAEQALLGSGMGRDAAAGVREILVRYREGGVTAEVSPAVEALTGRRPRSFADFLHDYRRWYLPVAA